MLPFGIGVGEMIVIGIVAVMLFGSRLPEVARQLGASYQQFRKGLNEIQTSIAADLDSNSKNSSGFRKITDRRDTEYRDYNSDANQDYEAPPVPKFVPPADDE